MPLVVGMQQNHVGFDPQLLQVGDPTLVPTREGERARRARLQRDTDE